MAFNATLGKNNAKAARTHVTATVTADKSDAGIKIVSSVLDVVVTGLEGTDAAGLSELAKKAEAGCPISNALRGNVGDYGQRPHRAERVICPCRPVSTLVR